EGADPPLDVLVAGEPRLALGRDRVDVVGAPQRGHPDLSLPGPLDQLEHQVARSRLAPFVQDGVERFDPLTRLVGVDVGELGGHPLGDDGWWFVSGSHGVLPFSLVVFTAILSSVRYAFYLALLSGRIP